MLAGEKVMNEQISFMARRGQGDDMVCESPSE